MSDDAIPAATVLLLRDEPAFEVLMVERHENIHFAGGALVFPGGRIDGGDHHPAWADRCDGFDTAPPEQRAARIAAIREAFEETGILLARHAGETDYVSDAFAQSVDDWRSKIERDGAKFLALARRENLSLACDALHLFAHWIPPKGVPKRRYDTLFFAARTPPGRNAREDGNEATEAVWIAPKDAVAARDRGERKMIFPTSRNVELLGLSRSVDEVFKFAAERKIAPVMPKVVERDGARFITIPDDLGYPVTEEPLETALRS